MNEDWPHQTRAVNETLSAVEAGEKRIAITSPTGGGKSRVMQRLIERFTEEGLRTACFINRRMLIDQLSNGLQTAGIRHGIRAAGHEVDLNYPVQICSVQTEHARSLKWDRFPAQRILVDEAHLMTGASHRAIFDAYEAEGTIRIGLTATPLDIGDLYDRLIVAGNNTELRGCGALVPCIHYGPDEPDLKRLKKLRDGQDLTEKQQRQAMKSPTLWARVIEWYRRLNPDQRPSILFAPGVPESLWFAEQFSKAGIPAAHIDGQEVWWNGQFWKSEKDIREEVLTESREGGCKVLCNRFVLREGIDCPWLAHGIFATVFGSLQSYLQAGGRLLRSFPGLEAVTVQDHGGNWHRHGSLNSDREWDLAYTASIVSGLRAERLRQKQESEPMRCPQCSRILIRGKCSCGFEVQPGCKSRPVVQEDGTLKEMGGDIYRPRRVTNHPEAAKIWERMYYRAKSKKWNATFNQAAAMFAAENNWGWPPKTLPLMPTEPLDWYRRVSEVPMERLTR